MTVDVLKPKPTKEAPRIAFININLLSDYNVLCYYPTPELSMFVRYLKIITIFFEK